ncbi:MAG: hypothetical protein AB7O38_27510 [Pirellulaceae bacterium]
MKPRRDPWIIGQGIATERPYIIHTEKPRFMAQVFEEGDPDGILAPLSYSLRDGRSLARFAFYDDLPDERTLRAILRWADEILARGPIA